MKGVLAICGFIVTVMFVSVGYQYHRFAEVKDEGQHDVSLDPIIDMSENYLDTVTTEHLPDWCNDSDYVDSVVIPMQEDHYNIEFVESPAVDSVTKVFDLSGFSCM